VKLKATKQRGFRLDVPEGLKGTVQSRQKQGGQKCAKIAAERKEITEQKEAKKKLSLCPRPERKRRETYHGGGGLIEPRESANLSSSTRGRRPGKNRGKKRSVKGERSFQERSFEIRTVKESAAWGGGFAHARRIIIEVVTKAVVKSVADPHSFNNA